MRTMMEGTLAMAADSMGGRLRGSDVQFRGVSTDTRTLQKGELFFALQGPNFDGAAFVEAAAGGHATGAVVPAPIDAGIPVIVVEDTLQALSSLAAEWRQRMPAIVIGITGSNGKTTLKEMIASCLSLSAATLPTQGNLNNEIGVPLMAGSEEGNGLNNIAATMQIQSPEYVDYPVTEMRVPIFDEMTEEQKKAFIKLLHIEM